MIRRAIWTALLVLAAAEPAGADGPCGRDFEYIETFHGFHSARNAGRLGIAYMAETETEAKKSQFYCAFRDSGSYHLPIRPDHLWFVLNNMQSHEEKGGSIYYVAKMELHHPEEVPVRIELFRGGADWQQEAAAPAAKYRYFLQPQFEAVQGALATQTSEVALEEELGLDFFGTTTGSNYPLFDRWLAIAEMRGMNTSVQVKNKITNIAFTLRDRQQPPRLRTDWATRVAFTVSPGSATSISLRTYGVPSHNVRYDKLYRVTLPE